MREGFDPQDAATFEEPWQAQLFALTVALSDRGLFTWGEWASALGREVGRPEARADGGDYYQHWLAALESLVVAKGISDDASIRALTEAWQRAAHATPHGKPIALSNDPGG